MTYTCEVSSPKGPIYPGDVVVVTGSVKLTAEEMRAAVKVGNPKAVLANNSKPMFRVANGPASTGGSRWLSEWHLEPEAAWADVYSKLPPVESYWWEIPECTYGSWNNPAKVQTNSLDPGTYTVKGQVRRGELEATCETTFEVVERPREEIPTVEIPFGYAAWIVDDPPCELLADPLELSGPGPYCMDGAVCHHRCEARKCFRKRGNNCTPLTASGLTDDWTIRKSAPTSQE